ncbi:MAG TPA: Ig-like domain-containing protein [Planctomycetota bacterium]|nr:Ig-like domain-containing protein [Planctomycetota bacterium]
MLHKQKLLLVITLAAICLVAPHAHGANVQIKYRDITYNRDDGSSLSADLPASYVQVTVHGPAGFMEGPFIAGTDGIITTTYAGDVADLTFAIRAIAVTGRQTVQVHLQSVALAHEVTQTAELVGVDYIATVSNTAVAPAFNICDVLSDGYDQLVTLLGAAPPEDFTLIARYENNKDGKYKNNGTQYDADGRVIFWTEAGNYYINVPAFGAGYDDDMILNAYARFLQAKFSKDNAPGDRHYDISKTTRGFGDNLDLRQAWSEGWAHFFPALVRGDSRVFYLRPDMKADLTAPIVASPPGVLLSGPQNEFAVASILWNIYIGLGPAHAGRIWTAFTSISGETDVCLEDFWKKIAIQWADAGKDIADLYAIGTSRGVSYKPDAGEANDTSATATPLDVSGGTVTAADMTFYPAGDVDYYSFIAKQQYRYKVETPIDTVTNGGDTVLCIEDAAGYVWAQEPEGSIGSVTSTIYFTAPFSTSYFVKCRRANTSVPLPAVDNTPLDGITSKTTAEFGSYSIKVTEVGVDIAKPAVLAWGPQGADVTASDIFVEFDKPVQPDTVVGAVYVTRDGEDVTATITAESLARYTMTLNESLQAGATYQINVTAGVVDLFGRTATAFTDTFTAPTITPSTPGADVTGPITVNFGHTIYAGASDIIVSGGIVGTVAAGGSPTVYTFTPTSALGHSTTYIVTVVGGKDSSGNPLGVYDAAGNPLVSNVVGTFTTKALAVSTVTPASGAASVALDSTIAVTFNDAVNAATVTTATFLVSSAGGPVAGTIALDPTSGGKRFVFTPTAPLQTSVTYTVTVTTGVRDPRVVALPSQFTSTFTTGALQVLSIQTIDDPDGIEVPPTCRVQVTFSSAVAPATVTASSFRITNQRTGALAAGAIAASAGNTVFTFTPATPMLKADQYAVTLTNAITDAGTTALSPPAPHTFTTAPLSLAVAAVDPAHGATNVPVAADVTVTFNESVSPATVTDSIKLYLKITDTREDAVPGSVAVDPADPGNNTVFTFTPAAPLFRNALYRIRVTGARDGNNNPTGVTDANGNPMIADLTQPCTFTTNPADGNYTLRGIAKYRDTAYNSASGAATNPLQAARYVTIRFYDAGGNQLGTVCLTDADGYYSHDFGAALPGAVTMRILSEGICGSQTLAVKKQTAAVVHSFDVSPAVNLATTSVLNADVTGAVAAAFNIYDTLTAGYIAVRNPLGLAAADPGAFTLTAFWESGQAAERTRTWGRTAFFLAGGAYEIDVPGDAATFDDDSFDDCVLLEAYARFLQQLYSYDDAPGDRHYTTTRSDKGYGVRLDLRQAWSEGWAHFFSSVVRNDTRAVYVHKSTPAVKFDIAAPQVFDPLNVQASGPDNQFAVASMLWAIKEDSPANLPLIWGVFNDLGTFGADPRNQCTLEEFYRVWVAKGYALSSAANTAAIARGIGYVADGLPSTLAEAAASAPVSVGAAAIPATLYPAGDIDYFKFEAVQDQQVQIKTSDLSSGADTILRVVDADGYVLVQEVAGRPDRSWAALTAATVSSIVFKAPYAGTNAYYAACSRSNVSLPVVDNEPLDSITSRCPANFGAYSLTIAAAEGSVAVAQVDPADARNDVAVDVGNVLIVFSSTVDPDTVTADTFTVKDPSGATVPGTISQIDQSRRYFEYIFTNDLATSAVYTIGVTAGVKDALGSPVTPFQSTFRTVGPFVASVSPAAGATDVAVDSLIVVTFLAAVDPASVTTATLRLLHGATVVAGQVAQHADDPLAFIFTPTDRLATSTQYKVQVNGVAANGVTMETAFESTFTTGKLQVAAWSPPDGTTGVGVALPDTGISITFNGAVDPATITNPVSSISSTIRVTRDNKNVDSWVQVTGPRTVVVRPAAYLYGEKAYTVKVAGGANGVKGINGDTMDQDATITFTTATRPVMQLGENVPRVTKAKAYSGSGFIDIEWKNPFGDWSGIIIAGSTESFPTLTLGADKDGNAILQVKNGQLIYQGEIGKTSYRISGLQNGGSPMRVNIWVVNGLDYSRAVSLESRAIAGATGMPGKIDEPEEDEEQQVLTGQPQSSPTLYTAPQAPAGSSSGGQPADPPAESVPVVVVPEPEPISGPLSEPVVGSVPGPMRAKAASGSGYVDVKWEVPDGAEGIIVAVGGGEFPKLKVGRDSDGNSAFTIAGGAKVFEGSESKRLRIATPNGTIRRFTLWTYAAGKVSRAVSLETRAVAGAAGLQ